MVKDWFENGPSVAEDKKDVSTREAVVDSTPVVRDCNVDETFSNGPPVVKLEENFTTEVRLGIVVGSDSVVVGSVIEVTTEETSSEVSTRDVNTLAPLMADVVGNGGGVTEGPTSDVLMKDSDNIEVGLATLKAGVDTEPVSINVMDGDTCEGITDHLVIMVDVD